MDVLAEDENLQKPEHAVLAHQLRVIEQESENFSRVS
jgi:hypothetical protein